MRRIVCIALLRKQLLSTSRHSSTSRRPLADARVKELNKQKFLAHLDLENAAHTRGSLQASPAENPSRQQLLQIGADNMRQGEATSFLSHAEAFKLRRDAAASSSSSSPNSQRSRTKAPSHMKNVLQQLRRAANEYHNAQAEDMHRQHFREALTAMLRHQSKLKALDPSVDSSAHGKAQRIQRLFQDAVQSLTPNHFKHASVDDLVSVLRSCSFVGIDSSLAVASAMVMLQANLGNLTVNQLSGAILAVATCNTTIPPEEKTEFVFAILKQLTETLDTISAGHLDPAAAALLSPREIGQCVNILRLAMKKGRDDTQFPQDLSKRFAEQLLTYLADKRGSGHANASGTLAAPRITNLQGWEIALLCTAITHFGVSIMTATTFLQPAAELVVACCQDMTGRQLSYILMAYATIGYRNVEFFITLGQCVGDLGETVMEDDVARVLRALALVGIEHEMLRNSLESSLRMRSLQRKPLFGKSF